MVCSPHDDFFEFWGWWLPADDGVLLFCAPRAWDFTRCSSLNTGTSGVSCSNPCSHVVRNDVVVGHPSFHFAAAESSSLPGPGVWSTDPAT